MSSEQEEGEYVLPLDILIEIFKRLPVKSSIKFSSVSKQWKSVIRSSPFISDHNNIQHQQTSDLFFVGFSNSRNFAIIKTKQTNKISGFRNRIYAIIKTKQTNKISGLQQRLTLPGRSDDNFRTFDSPHLIGYSQGLFGFYNYVGDEYRLVIVNPSIKKSVFIPLPPDHTRRCLFYDFCFTVVCKATEPTIFCITYKIPLRVQIYTLSATAWRTVSYTYPRESLKVTMQMVVTDRFIYWTAIDRAKDGSKSYVIMSFDIISEQFTELCLPPTLAAHTYLELSKLKESLVVLEIDVRKKEIGVWMMEAGGVENSFTKQFTVNLPALTYRFAVEVLGFPKEGQLILHIKSARKLLMYEPGSKSFKFIRKVRKKEDPRLAGLYMETLLLFDH